MVNTAENGTPEHREAEVFRQLADSLVFTEAPVFFDNLARRLSELLEMEHVLIGVIDSNGTEVETVAFCSNGALQAPTRYPLTGTPCENVVGRDPCIYPCDVINRFPSDHMLVDLQAESYIGMPMFTPVGTPLGLIAALGSQPLGKTDLRREVLRIAATQAGAELSRRQAERERAESERRVHQLAFEDPVTGLANRAWFMERLSQLENTGASGLGLALIDLRHFKDINDTQGQEVGDQILKTIGHRLLATLRRGQQVARLGGNEYAVLLPETQATDLPGLAERLRHTVSRPIPLGTCQYTFSCSIGAAHMPRDAHTTEELFNNASIALHLAKRQHQEISLFDADMANRLHHRQSLLKEFTEALHHDGLSLHFQPIVEAGNHQLAGAEVLCRWQDPHFGQVSPGEFIPLAEQNGMIGALGDWVTRHACRQLQQWESRGHALPGRLSINLSAQQLEDMELVTRLRRHTRDVDASRVRLELTESAFMRDPDQSVALTRALRETGYGLAIDDFGTGYSSLAYLKLFAADTLKIDMSFVQDMLQDSNDRTIVETIIAMARTLGMTTVAEGVETAEQAECLKHMGCDRLQGFFFGRPLPAGEFVRTWLAPPDEVAGYRKGAG